MDEGGIELVARNYLVNQLYRCGVEVAQPLRDIGVDLVAYLDRDCPDRTFRAWPLQLKANSSEGFSIDGKYAAIASLMIVFAWHLESEAAVEFYALSYDEIESLAASMGWARQRGQRWAVTKPSQQLRQLLQAHRVQPSGWREFLLRQPIGTQVQR